MKANVDWKATTDLVSGGFGRSRRVAVSLPVRVQSNGQAGKFEEVSTTLNVSCDGVYFHTRSSLYRVGMALVVTLPYSTETDLCAQFFGKVLRIDPLSDCRFGIAVELVVVAPKLSNERSNLVVG
jgi:hypothetical protein